MEGEARAIFQYIESSIFRYIERSIFRWFEKFYTRWYPTLISGVYNKRNQKKDDNKMTAVYSIAHHRYALPSCIYTARSSSFFNPFRTAVPFGDKPLKLQVVFPQNGTAVLKGLKKHFRRDLYIFLSLWKTHLCSKSLVQPFDRQVYLHTAVE